VKLKDFVGWKVLCELPALEIERRLWSLSCSGKDRRCLTERNDAEALRNSEKSDSPHDCDSRLPTVRR